eukprot:4629758-Ditylum_brightwellii.AAC.1
MEEERVEDAKGHGSGGGDLFLQFKEDCYSTFFGSDGQKIIHLFVQDFGQFDCKGDINFHVHHCPVSYTHLTLPTN